MSRSSGVLRGLGVRWPEWTAANVRVNASSLFTQAGPRPGTASSGDAASRLMPTVAGSQTIDLDHAVTRSGSVGGDWSRALAVGWRPDGASTWRGWEGPGTVTWWSAYGVWVAGDFTTAPEHGFTKTRGGRLIAAVLRGSGLQTYITDPRTCASTNVQIFGFSTTPFGTCMTTLPDGRVLLFVAYVGVTQPFGWRAYYSDNEGASWTLYDANPFEGLSAALLGAVGGSSSISANTTGEVVFFKTDGTDSVQLSSNALGASFGLVQVATGSGIGRHQFVPLASGGWLFVYVNSVNSDVEVRRVASASVPLTSLSATSVAVGTYDDVCAWEDPTGRVYVLASGSGTESRLFYSDDSGATWTAAQAAGRFGGDPLRQGDTATRPFAMRAESVGGAVWIGHMARDGGGGGTFDSTLRILRLGGWEDVEHSAGYVGSGDSIQFVPWELPDTIAAWTPAGAGTAFYSAFSTNDGLTLSTAANQKNYTTTFAGGYVTRTVFADLTMVSGGSVTTNAVSIRMLGGNGANTVQCDLRFSTSQIRLVEGAVAVTLGTATVSTTSRIQIKMELRYNGTGTDHTVTAWYKRPAESAWTQIATGSCTATAGATTPRVEWGHRTNTTSESIWHVFSVASAPVRSGLGTINGAPAALLGRGVPEASGTSAMCLIGVRQGPGRVGETHDIARSFDYPLSAAFSEVSPSPSAAKWRSTGTGTTVNLAVTRGRLTRVGNGSLVLYISGANFRLAHLQAFDGFTWSTIGFWDAASGFDPVASWTQGELLSPDYIGGGAGARYLQFGELVGGTAVIDGTRYRKITRQTEGWWAQGDRATQRKAWLTFEGADGTETTFATNTQLWAPSGVLVVHNVVPAQGYRVQIPAQTTADGYFTAGVVYLGALHAFGRRFGRGYQIGSERVVDATEDAYGTTQVRERGPRRRVVSFAWADPVDLTQLRRATPGGYFAADAGEPLAAVGDVPWLLDGIERDTKSGERPVLWLPNVPNTDAMITDPSRYIYGRLEVGETTHALGETGSNEVVRVSEVSIREIS